MFSSYVGFQMMDKDQRPSNSVLWDDTRQPHRWLVTNACEREHAASTSYVEVWILATSTQVSEETCLYLQMETADSSKLLVLIYRTTMPHNLNISLYSFLGL
jgi:hypothetical protein